MWGGGQKTLQAAITLASLRVSLRLFCCHWCSVRVGIAAHKLYCGSLLPPAALHSASLSSFGLSFCAAGFPKLAALSTQYLMRQSWGRGPLAGVPSRPAAALVINTAAVPLLSALSFFCCCLLQCFSCCPAATREHISEHIALLGSIGYAAGGIVQLLFHTRLCTLCMPVSTAFLHACFITLPPWHGPLRPALPRSPAGCLSRCVMLALAAPPPSLLVYSHLSFASLSLPGRPAHPKLE